MPIARALPTVGGDNNAWGTKINAWLEQGLGTDGLVWVNVKDPTYGALGNGSADDTTKIQAAIDACISASSPWTTYAIAGVYLPPGEYKITAPLVIPASYGLRIRGAGRYTTTISQATDGQYIFNFTHDLTLGTHISDMTVQYGSQASQIDSSNAGSVAFNYRVTGGASGGFFYHTYRNIHIRGAYRGFSLYETDGNQTLWGVLWEDILFEHIKNRCVSLNSAGGIGIPNCVFIKCAISNTGSPSITNTGEAFMLNAVNEAIFYGGNWEGWNDTVITAQAGSYVSVTGVHIENHIFSAAASKLFIIGNATLTTDTVTVSGVNTAGNATSLALFQMESGGRLWIRGGWHNVDSSIGAAGGGGGLPEVLWGDGSADIALGATFEDFLNYSSASKLNDPGKYGGFGINRASSTAAFLAGGVRALVYSGTIATTGVQPSRTLKIVASNGTGFTISNPTNLAIGERIIYDIKNSAGGAMGAVTWGSGGTFLLPGGTFTRPANTKRTTIEFYNDGTNMVALGPQSGDA